MHCVGGLIVIIIYFKIQNHFQSGYFHSSLAVMEHNFGLQRQVNKGWVLECQTMKRGLWRNLDI